MRMMIVIDLPPLEKFAVNISLKVILKFNCSYWN